MRTQIRTRRAHETVSVIYEIKHWWNHKRARDHTDDERDLLLPWRGIDKLARLQILARSKAAPITTKIPMPESGLLEEPISPAM